MARIIRISIRIIGCLVCVDLLFYIQMLNTALQLDDFACDDNLWRWASSTNITADKRFHLAQSNQILKDLITIFLVCSKPLQVVSRQKSQRQPPIQVSDIIWHQFLTEIGARWKCFTRDGTIPDVWYNRLEANRNRDIGSFILKPNIELYSSQIWLYLFLFTN